ncbi:MAG: flavin-containing monooxygenase, partial [Acidimicrobiia bacterium]
MSIMHDQRSGHAYGHQHVDVASVPMTTEVGIIGGGFGGIAAAVNLQKAGVDDFVVIESSDGPGGTWRDNTYPGAACDVPSILYSYSFHRKPEWSRVYATQPEILRYLEDTVDAFGLRHKLMLSTRIEEARWDEETGTWLLWTTGGSALRFRAVISSVGLLNVPKIPEVPGLDSFKGEQMHTSRWRHDVNIDGKAVAVVGTGSSSAQVVPGVIDRVGKLNLYQRQPAWIIGKDDRPYTHAELARHRIPFVLVLKRLSLFWGKVATRVSRDPQSARNKALQA